MKKTLIKCMNIIGIACMVLFSTANAQKSESGTYAVNVKASSLAWKGTKVTGEHIGTILLKNGKIDVTNGKITGGEYEIDMTTITNTDQEGEWKAKLEGHLKSDDFFSVEKHPVSKLVITKAEALKDNNYNVTGKLTIKGITNEITFPAVITLNQNKLAGSADFNIDRTKWDVRYGSGKFFEGLGDKMIYDDINFKVKLEATK